MPYALGIDLGTARTVAAVSRNRLDSWSEPALVPLDPAADRPGVASVLHFTGDDTVEVGEAAGRARPDRVARDFLDRIGDEVPLALGGQHYPAESLAAALVAWVVDRAEALEGTAATQLVVTHPVGWGAHRRALLQAALRELNLPELTMLPRPVAAAEAYAANERLEVGEEVAVYSLGAGRFEAAVLRRGSFGFEPRGHADSTDVLGGALFDDLLAEHATADLGEVPGSTGVLAAFRAACVAAKERLSTAATVTIPAPPGAQKATVLVDRTDFDALVRPVVEHTVRILQRAITAADSTALRAVVLVGGCANVPLVAELVSAAVRARVVAADDPTTAIARGAAIAAGRVAKPTVQAPAVPAVTQHTDLMRFDDLGPEVPDIGPPPPRPPVELAPLDPPARGLARLTRRARPQEDEEDLDLREDEDRPRRKRHQHNDEAQDEEVDLLTHTRRRPDKDADFLAHLRNKSSSDDSVDDSVGDDLLTHKRTPARRPNEDAPATHLPHDDHPGPTVIPDPTHDEAPMARRKRPTPSEDHEAAAHYTDPRSHAAQEPPRPDFTPADLPMERARSNPNFAPTTRHDNPPGAHADEADHRHAPVASHDEPPTEHPGRRRQPNPAFHPATHHNNPADAHPDDPHAAYGPHDEDHAEHPSHRRRTNPNLPPTTHHGTDPDNLHAAFAPHDEAPTGRRSRPDHSNPNFPPAHTHTEPAPDEPPGRRRRPDNADPNLPPSGAHTGPHDEDPTQRPGRRRRTHHDNPDEAPADEPGRRRRANRSHPSFPPATRHDAPPAGAPAERPARRRRADHSAPSMPRHDAPLDEDPAEHRRRTHAEPHRDEAPAGRRRRPDHAEPRGRTNPNRHDEPDLPDPRTRSNPNFRPASEDHHDLPGPRNRTNHAPGRHHEPTAAPDEPAFAHPRRRHRRLDAEGET